MVRGDPFHLDVVLKLAEIMLRTIKALIINVVHTVRLTNWFAQKWLGAPTASSLKTKCVAMALVAFVEVLNVQVPLEEDRCAVQTPFAVETYYVLTNLILPAWCQRDRQTIQSTMSTALEYSAMLSVAAKTCAVNKNPLHLMHCFCGWAFYVFYSLTEIIHTTHPFNSNSLSSYHHLHLSTLLSVLLCHQSPPKMCFSVNTVLVEVHLNVWFLLVAGFYFIIY